MRKKKDDNLKLLKDEKEKAIDNIKQYIYENFDFEISNLQSDMFLDFISEKIGIYYYNKGIMDCMNFMAEKNEELYLLMKEED